MQDFLAKVNPKQKKYFTQLRSALLEFPEVEESIDIDEISGEWCPAYRVRGSDFVWVHFNEQMWINFPVEPRFEKKALQDENLDSELAEAVKDAEDTGGEKWVKLEIKSGDRVDQLIPLLKLRHSVLLT